MPTLTTAPTSLTCSTEASAPERPSQRRRFCAGISGLWSTWSDTSSSTLPQPATAAAPPRSRARNLDLSGGVWKRPFFAPDSSLGGTSSSSSGSDNGLTPSDNPIHAEEPKSGKEGTPEGDEGLVDVVVVDRLLKPGDGHELPPSTTGARRPSTSAANFTDDARTGRPCWSDNELAHGGRKRLQWAWRVVSVFFWVGLRASITLPATEPLTLSELVAVIRGCQSRSRLPERGEHRLVPSQGPSC